MHDGPAELGLVRLGHHRDRADLLGRHHRRRLLLRLENRVGRTIPLFLGLARPPKYLGLPVGYLVVLATGVVLPFIWTKSMVFFLIGLVAYPILWFVADREPHFFEVLRVSYGSVRPTKNRAMHGGDSFGA
ncbi:type IV secretion system protein VirB3 [Sulfitobacter pacificus]|uniref:type IV secretion system protein VirB3 n=1 Tax=Sulfitobacter pacificus TaxID=1499314 RepID=UPI00360F031A